MNIEELEERLPGALGTTCTVDRKDLILREDVVNAIRDACIKKHIPFSSKSPEGKRVREVIWAAYTTPAAIPAAELGAASGVYDRLYDRLRELLKADREGRCVVLMVVPGNTPAADVVVIKNKEAYLVRPSAVSVRPFGGKSGGLVCSYKTDGTLDFTDISIGKTVFLPHEAEKIEAALAKMREENHD